MSKQEIFTLAAVKGFKGHEGEPLHQGSLKRGTKVVGSWSEDSWGGALRAHFNSKEDQVAFIEWAKTYLKDKRCLGKPYDMTVDSAWYWEEHAIGELLEEHLHLKQAAKSAKDGRLAICVKQTQWGEGIPYSPLEYGSYKGLKYCQKHINQALAELKVPKGCEVEILNATLGQTMLSDEEADKLAEVEWLQGLCKKGLVISWKEPGKEGTSIKTLKVPYTAESAKQVRERYPNNIVEIVNERFAKL